MVVALHERVNIFSLKRENGDDVKGENCTVIALSNITLPKKTGAARRVTHHFAIEYEEHLRL